MTRWRRVLGLGFVSMALMLAFTNACTPSGIPPEDPFAADAAAGATPFDGGSANARTDAATLDAAWNDPIKDVPEAASKDAGSADAEANPTADASALARCVPVKAAGHQKVNCAVKLPTRDVVVSFDVEADAKCLTTRCGIIVDVHGYSMTGDQQDRHTHLRTLAPPRGYIVIEPTAPVEANLPLTSWSSTGAFSRDYDYDTTVWKFVMAAAAEFSSDPDRLHFTGFSQGGMLTFRMMCGHAAEIASVAPAAGVDCLVHPTPIGAPTKTTERPARTVPILYTHGTGDPLMSFPHAEAVRDALVIAYGLGAPERIKTESGYRADRYSLDGKSVFEFWTHDFSQGDFFIKGHCMPGPIAPRDGLFANQDAAPYRCLDAQAYDFGETVLAFFETHPRTP